MMKTEWIHCPVCGNKTRVKLRKDSILVNFPLYCPKCRHEMLIQAKDSKIVIIKEPDA
nr:cysteine-rich KTR domain-containing protein [Acutalibacter muris]